MSHSVGKLIGNIVIPEYRSWPEDKQEQFAEKDRFPGTQMCACVGIRSPWCVDAGDCVLFAENQGEKRTDYYAGVQVRHTQQQMNSINFFAWGGGPFLGCFFH